MPLRDIAAELTSRNIPTPRGSIWNQVTVMRAMKRLGIAGRRGTARFEVPPGTLRSGMSGFNRGRYCYRLHHLDRVETAQAHGCETKAVRRSHAEAINTASLAPCDFICCVEITKILICPHLGTAGLNGRPV